MNSKEIADKLWAEYLRVDEWAKTEDERHSAKVAIRCCATRLNVYPDFVNCDKD